jgi:hypothetical protein
MGETINKLEYLQSESLKFRKNQYEQEVEANKGKPRNMAKELIDYALFQACIQQDQANQADFQAQLCENDRQLNVDKNVKLYDSYWGTGLEVASGAGKIAGVVAKSPLGKGGGVITETIFGIAGKQVNEHRQGQITLTTSQSSADSQNTQNMQARSRQHTQNSSQSVQIANEITKDLAQKTDQINSR